VNEDLVDLNTLMRDFNFTADDLELNRQGKMSQAQQDRLLAKAKQIRGSCSSMAASTLGIGLLLFIIIVVLNSGEIGLLAMILGAGAVVLAIGMLIFGLSVFRTFSRVGQVPVVRTSGTIQLEQGGKSIANRKYFIHLGDTLFPVPEQAFRHLENGGNYALYTRANSNDILSVEPV
jgi:hypothetical protein